MTLDQQLLMAIIATLAALAFFWWFCIGNGAFELEFKMQIWFYRANCWLDRAKFNIQRAVANMLPRWLVEMATIRLVVHATTGKYGATDVSELRAMTALRRWNKK